MQIRERSAPLYSAFARPFAEPKIVIKCVPISRMVNEILIIIASQIGCRGIKRCLAVNGHSIPATMRRSVPDEQWAREQRSDIK